MSVTVQDLNAGDLATLLANAVDAKTAGHLEQWAANHLPSDGLTPVAEDDGTPGQTITGPLLDAEGTNAQFLQVIGDGDTIDTSLMTHLHAILLEDSQPGSQTIQTIIGSGSANVYTADTNAANEFPGSQFIVDGSGSTGTLHINLGLDDGDRGLLGSGNGSSVTAQGTDADLQTGTGNFDTLTGNAAGDFFSLGYGSNQLAAGAGDGDTFVFNGNGTNSTAIGLGNNDAFLGGKGAAGETGALEAGLGNNDTFVVSTHTETETVLALGLNAAVHVQEGANASVTIYVADPNSVVNLADVSTNFTSSENKAGNVDTLTDASTGQTIIIHGKANLVYGDGVTGVANPTDPPHFDHLADMVEAVGHNAHVAEIVNHWLVG